MSVILMLLSKPLRGDIRVNREAKTLSDAGHSVIVFSWDREGNMPREEACADNISLRKIRLRCPERSFSNFMFRLPLFYLAALLISRKESFLIVHAHDLDTLPLGFMIARLRRCPLVYDAHESYADMISDDAPGFVVSIARWLEGRLLRFTDTVIVAGEMIASRIGAGDHVTILNCPGATEVSTSCEERTRDREGARKLGYFGSLEPGRFISEALDVIECQRDWKLTIAGDGTLTGDVKEAARRSDMIEYPGHISHAESLRLQQSCDSMLVMFDSSNENNRIGTPNRLFEAMALGIPSILTSGTNSALIATKERCGFVCTYERESLAELLRSLYTSGNELARAGAAGRAAFEREYNWGVQSKRLLTAYSRLLEPPERQ